VVESDIGRGRYGRGIFAVLRGFMLTALTVPWLAQKIRRADATESERSLVLMVGSRTILLGLGILALWLTNRREAVAWALLGDGVLQLFDALLALAQRKRTLAVLPTILCLLDGWAGATLMGNADRPGG
jgi:hypothetical protein